MNKGISLAKPNLDDSRIMSSSEACKIWGIDSSTLRKQIHLFPKGTIRKLGRDWIVTVEGMNHVFGTVEQTKYKRKK
jgi:hypothetical protein